jgi:hypothetical protein
MTSRGRSSKLTMPARRSMHAGIPRLRAAVNVRPKAHGVGKGWGAMAIYTIVQYRVRPSGVDKVKRAIEEFVRVCRPTNQTLDRVHSQSKPVKHFEAAHSPKRTVSLPGLGCATIVRFVCRAQNARQFARGAQIPRSPKEGGSG